MRALLASLFLLVSYANAASLVGATDPNISYTGRWDKSNASAPWAFWKGASIIVNFEGTSIAIDTSSTSTDYLRVFINGVPAISNPKISVSSDTGVIELASGLSDTIHQLEIVKETDSGRWTFRGFELDNGKGLVGPPARPPHKIAFYGDSNLAGYSLEHEQNQSGNHLRGTYYGFAGIVSRIFDAEYHNVSRSGATIRTLNGFYDQFDNGSRNPKWDFNDFVADVVVVNIGANDVGRPKSRIKAYYHNLFDDLRIAHPDAHIVVYNGWGWDYDEPANYTHEVITERGDPNMTSAIFPWLFEQWHGCEYDHAGMAQVLANHLNTVMGWTLASSDVMSGYGVNGNVANGGFESVAPFGGYGWRYYTDSGVSRVDDPLGASSGDHYLRLSNGAASHQPNPAVAGDTVDVSVQMRGASAGDSVNVTIDFRDQEMWTEELTSTTETVVLTTTWQPYNMSVMAPFGTPRPIFHTRLTFTAASGDTVDIDDVVMTVRGDTGDIDAPTPDPMTWASLPDAISGSAVIMTATAATDVSGVEYFFDCVSGDCNDSGWQDSNTYTDIGLQDDFDYSYRVRARDKSASQNLTGYSPIETASTPPSTCNVTGTHVESIVVSTFGVGQGRKRGRAIVTVVDDCGDPVAVTNVDGTFFGSFNESSSAVTIGNGVATFETNGTKKGRTMVTFCVDDIASTPGYNESDNAETCDSL